MVLALQYMKRTGQASPSIAARATEHIDKGYQRLLGFEVREEPGGFDWWGRPPANLFLSAYALVEFHDMAEVYPVDPALLARIRAYLRGKQQEDGSWRPEGLRTGWSTDMAKGQAFNLTAYVAWGMAQAGAPDAKALAWLETQADEATDPYGIALGALAFLASDPKSATGRRLAARVAGLARSDAAGVFWTPVSETAIGARGASARIEATALAVMALLLEGGHPRLAEQGLRRIVAWRDPQGTFGTTQSTILALKALLLAEAGAARRGPMKVRAARGSRAATLDLLPDSTEAVRHEFGTSPSDTPVELSAEGEGSLRATVSRVSWASWDDLGPPAGRLDLSVRYPEEVLRPGSRAEAQVRVRNRTAKDAASVVTLEIGIPPGCDVEPEDVVLVAPKEKRLENVERDERTVVVYLRDLAPGEEVVFTVGFKPRYAIDVLTAPSKAYEYYTPEEAVLVRPARVRARR